jgi:hypothetical protein
MVEADTSIASKKSVVMPHRGCKCEYSVPTVDVPLVLTRPEVQGIPMAADRRSKLWFVWFAENSTRFGGLTQAQAPGGRSLVSF